MRLKLITSYEADVSVTVDDAHVNHDYPSLDTAPGLCSLRIDDHSDGTHAVIQAQLGWAEALAIGEVLVRWTEDQQDDEQGERRADAVVDAYKDMAAPAVEAMQKNAEVLERVADSQQQDVTPMAASESDEDEKDPN